MIQSGMDFLALPLSIMLVDENDNVIGYMDRWEAHKKGLLHRAFTLLVRYQESILLQHRKHPVFDDVWDATSSSHPYKTDTAIQTIEDSINDCLKREWEIATDQLAYPPIQKGVIRYQAHDPKSEFIENEICHIYECEIKSLMMPNLACAYGYTLVSPRYFYDTSTSLYSGFAPWVQKMIDQKLIK